MAVNRIVCSLASWCVLEKFPLKKCISKVFCLKVRKCGKESLVPVIMAMDSLAAGSDTTGAEYGIISLSGKVQTYWSKFFFRKYLRLSALPPGSEPREAGSPTQGNNSCGIYHCSAHMCVCIKTYPVQEQPRTVSSEIIGHYHRS